jgi:transcriptional regulator with XRE-family HTH domain
LNQEKTVVELSKIVFRDDLYPRIKHDPALVQRYAENIDVLPPIEVNQHCELIDGWHRWTAHRKIGANQICIVTTQTKSESEFLKLAIERNSNHGKQLEEEDKKSMAIRLFNAGTGESKEEIARVLSVTVRTVGNYLNDIERNIREARKQHIFEMWMSCYTQEEIAEATGVSIQPVKDTLSDFSEGVPKNLKVQSLFNDTDFTPPLYNIWTFAKKSNAVSHFGNSEQRIVDNLLYLYTEPFDIVVDPFAGGGSTIDACKYRLRRYWTSDRKPIPEREKEIRKHDITVDGLPPLNRNWSQVTLTYLDPPYWRQAAGQYSDDAADLANMPLEEFTKTMADLVKGIASKQSKGVIALLIQPTQWSADNRQFTDHVTDIIQAVGNKKLVLENRISCPYSTEQYNAQQVEWSKANRKLLVLTRELIVWRVN